VPLPDGRVGVVAEVGPDRPEEPLPRVDGADVRADLREQAAQGLAPSQARSFA
jgi:hypothetical protein